MIHSLERHYVEDLELWVRRDQYGNKTFDHSGIEEFFVKDNFARGILELPPRSIVFDVGAHIGFYALRIETLRPDLHIYAFEPEPENFGMLVRNLTVNMSNITPVQLAMSNQNGYINLTNREHTGSWSAVLEGPMELATLPVYGVTITQAMKMCKVDRIDYLKLDVEGMEKDILPSIPDAILRNIAGMDLELHDELPEIIQLQLLALLRDAGFYPFPWTPIGPKLDLRRM